MFNIIIHVFQMDNCILMKYYFHVFDHNSCISNKYYFNVYEIIIHAFQMDINEILF